MSSHRMQLCLEFFGFFFKYVCVLLAQLCLTRDLKECRPPGSSVPGILQARILEWLPFPSSGDLPNPGIKPTSHVSWIGRRVLYH